MFGFDDAIAAFSAASSLFGGQNNNDTSRDIASANNATSIDLANTAHTREVTDLKNAGLNPMLSYFGKGAAIPSFSQPNLTNSAAAASQSYAQTRDALSQKAQTQANVDVAKSQADLNVSSAARQDADARAADAQADNLRASTPNIPLTGQKLIADTNVSNSTVSEIAKRMDLNSSQIELLQKEVQNAMSTGSKIRAETGNINMDSALKAAQRQTELNRPAQVSTDTASVAAAIPKSAAISKVYSTIGNSADSIQSAIANTMLKISNDYSKSHFYTDLYNHAKGEISKSLSTKPLPNPR